MGKSQRDVPVNPTTWGGPRELENVKRLDWIFSYSIQH